MAEAEQHFILRVQDAELAGKLRGWLRDSDKDSDKIEELRLLFDDGKWRCRGKLSTCRQQQQLQHFGTTAADVCALVVCTAEQCIVA